MAADSSQSNERRRRRWPRHVDVEEIGRPPGHEAAEEVRPFRGRGIPSREGPWAPVVDVYDKEDRYIVRADLPGMTEDDFDISISENILTIKGDRRPPADVHDEEYALCETCYGPFVRTILLRGPIDADRAEAIYGDGVLEIQVPKAAVVTPTKVRVTAK